MNSFVLFPGRERIAVRGGAWLFALLLLLGASNATADVRAWFDRSTVSLGETVTLNVESAGRTEPDFSVLEKDFRIAGRSTNSEVRIINGAMARTNLWAVALEPLREGVIAVPGIPVGNEQTQPLSLTVQPMTRGSAASGDDVFMEVEVDTTNPYVQQQISYTIRLYYAVQLLGGELDEPSGDGMQVRRMGQDANYSRQIGGRRYNVVERRYAIAPERSGRLVIRGVIFRGRTASAGQHSPFFSQGTPLTTGSEEIALDVRPAPDSASLPWLPTRSLQLRDDSSSLPAEVHVGDALELTLSAEARGLSADQLPELSLPPIAGAEVYPDQETRETREVDGELVGKRTRKFAIVPLREGRLELPERSLSWWNPDTDQAARSALPARSLNVLPSAVAELPTDSASSTGVTDLVGDVDSRLQSLPDHRLWQSLASAFAVAWLLTLAAWRWQVNRLRRQEAADKPQPSTASSIAWRPALAHAIARRDLSAAGRALLRMRSGTQDLESLGAKLGDAAQRDAVLALQRTLYRGDADDGLLERLQTAFARSPVFVEAVQIPEQRERQLPPLYPPHAASGEPSLQHPQTSRSSSRKAGHKL